MSHLLDELLAQAANGSPITAAFSAEDVAVLFFASEFLGIRENWLDKGVDPLDEVTDADWDEIEKLVGNVYEAMMTPLVGQIVPIMLATVPSNMLACDGASHLRADYPVLYAALDAAFIVDADHFVTPDLRGRTVLGSGTGTGLSTYAVNASGGVEGVILTASQNGIHTHLLTDPGHAHTPAIPDTVFRAAHGGGSSGYATVNAGQVITQPTATGVNGTGITVQNSAGGSSHENRQPYRALQYAVVAF
jgi:microcystin-dependent protein